MQGTTEVKKDIQLVHAFCLEFRLIELHSLDFSFFFYDRLWDLQALTYPELGLVTRVSVLEDSLTLCLHGGIRDVALSVTPEIKLLCCKYPLYCNDQMIGSEA